MNDSDYRVGAEEAVLAAIDEAEEVFDQVAEQGPEKPRLLVENWNPDVTVAALRDILAEVGGLYDRGVPVRLAFDQVEKGMTAQPLTPNALVRAHGVPPLRAQA